MAKKDKNEVEYDDIDDFDLDIPEIDIDLENDSRSPVAKLSTGFAQGVKDDLTDRRDAPRKLKKMLPEDYESSIDLADETLGTVGNLYNSLRDETKEGTKSLRRAARNSVGKHTDKMPKWLGSRIESLLGEDKEERKDPSVDDLRNEEIENTLGNIFKLQAEKDEAENKEEEAKQSVRDAVAGKQHETQVEQLFGIRQQVARQVEYQDQITARYQRKSLEMQYRQFFLTKDIFSVSEATAKDTKEALQSIVKNTSLPDYRKIELTEAVGQQFRDQLTGGIQNKVSELGSGFIGRASQSLQKASKDRFQQWNEQMQSMAGMMEMANDASDMMDPYEQAGSTAGGALSGLLFNRLMAPAARRMGMSNQKTMDLGQDAKAGVDNIGRTSNEWLKEHQGTGGVLGFIADSIGSTGLDDNLTANGIESSLDPSLFDRQTRQSIVEVIPGFLSRIHHELQGFRRGMGVDDPDPNGRITFNQKERGFSTVEREREAIRDMVFPQDKLVDSFDRMADTVESLDIEKYIPEELQDDVYSTLSQHLMKESMDGKNLSLEKLSDSTEFGENVSTEISQAIADAVQKRYNTRTETDDFGNEVFKSSEDRNDITRFQRTRGMYNDIHQDVGNPRDTIQALMQIGGEDQLRELGVLDYDKSGNPSIDYDQIFRVYEQGGYDDQGGRSVRERREERRYDRWWENREAEDDAYERAQRDRRDDDAKREKQDRSWLGRARRKTKEAWSGGVDRAKDAVGMDHYDRRYETVERAENNIANRKASSYTPKEDSVVIDRLVEGARNTTTKSGRDHLKRDFREKAEGAYETLTDAEKRREAGQRVSEGYDEARQKVETQGAKAKQRFDESKVGQSRAGDAVRSAGETIKKTSQSAGEMATQTKQRAEVFRYLQRFDPDHLLSEANREHLKEQLTMELASGGKVDTEALAYTSTYMEIIPPIAKVQLASHFNTLNASNAAKSQEPSAKKRFTDFVKDDSKSWREKGEEAYGASRRFAEDASKHITTDKEGGKRSRKLTKTIRNSIEEVYNPNLSTSDNARNLSKRFPKLSMKGAAQMIQRYNDENSSATKNLKVDNFRHLVGKGKTETPEETSEPATASFENLRRFADERIARRNQAKDLTQSGDEDIKDPITPSVYERMRRKASEATAGAESLVKRKEPQAFEDMVFERVAPPEAMDLLNDNRRRTAKRSSFNLATAGADARSFLGQIFGQQYDPYNENQGGRLTNLLGGNKNDRQYPVSTEEGGYDSDRRDVVGTDVSRSGATNVASRRGGDGDDSRNLSPAANDDAFDSQNPSSLTNVLMGVRDILKGNEDGVTKEVMDLSDRLTVDGDYQADEAQVAILSRILETVEGIGAAVAKGDEESWFNLLDIGKKTGRVMGKTAGAFGNFYLGSLKMMGGGLAGVGRTLGGAGRMTGNLLGRAVGLGKKEEIGAVDVYLKGQPEPVLESRVMEEEGYFDSETGETINKVDDLYKLKGDVVDQGGNIVATAGELSKGLYDRFGRDLGGQGLLGKLASGVGRGIKAFTSTMFSPAKMLLNAPKKAWSLASKFFNRVRDVYVKGESKPRLLATIMKNGGYVNASTGRPIYSIKDINGEVLDRQNNVVLSHADMQQGLVDWKGESFGFLDRQLRRIKGAVKVPFKAAGWALGKARDTLSWGSEKVGNLVGGLTDRFTGSSENSERMMEQGDEQLDVLKEIRDLIKEQNKGEKDRLWDTNDDGMRDGGWRSLMAKDAEYGNDDEEEEKYRRDKKDGSMMSTILKLAGPLVGILTSVLTSAFDLLPNWLKDFFDFDINGPGGRGPGNETKKERKERKRRERQNRRNNRSGNRSGGNPNPSDTDTPKKGFWKKLKDWGWMAGERVWKTIKSPKTRNFGRNLLKYGKRVPKNPWAIGGAAVIGGGYFAYKKFFGDPHKLDMYRTMQYGLNPSEDNVAKMLFLEDHLKDVYTFKSNGTIKTDEDNFDIEKVAKELDVDLENDEQREHFQQWFAIRFMPVYSQARKGLSNIDEGKDLTKVKDLKAEKARDYFSIAKDPADPASGNPHAYEAMITPTGASAQDAEKINKEKQRLIQEMREKDQREKMLGGEFEADSAVSDAYDFDVGGILSSESLEDDSWSVVTSDQRLDKMAKIKKRVTSTNITRENYETIKSKVETYSENKTVGRKTIAIDFLMYKAMGLKKPTPEKVAALEDLIDWCTEYFTSDPKFGYEWPLGTQTAIDKKGKNFDVNGFWASVFGSNKDAVLNWKMWFAHRFMAVLLTFMNAIRSLNTRDPKKARERLRDAPKIQKFAAEKMMTLEVDVEDETIPIWDIGFSPWSDEGVLTDAKSAEPLLRYIEGLVPEEDEEEMEEPGDKKDIDPKADEEEAGLSDKEKKERQRKRDEEQRQRDARREEEQDPIGKGSANQTASTQNTNLDSRSSNNETIDAGNSKPPEGMTGSRATTTVPRNEGYERMLAGINEYGITDPEEQAMVLAQMGHESAGFTATEENLNYGASQLSNVFGKYFNNSQAASYARNPEAIANRVYGNRMGNTEEGDGWKYRGRGFIQLTGKNNYQALSDATGVDYVSNPDLVSDPEHSAKASLWWWKNRAGLPESAQRGDVQTSTEKINGGHNGLSDRIKRYNTHLPEAKEGKITQEAIEAAKKVSGGSDDDESTEELSSPMEETALTSAIEVGSQKGEKVDGESEERKSYRSGGSPSSEALDSLDEEENKPTARQSISGSSSIDSSEGLNNALDRDPEAAKKDQERRDRVQAVQDDEDRRRSESQHDSMSMVVDILENSLETQRNIDGRLKSITEILSEQSKAEGGTEDSLSPTRHDPSEGKRRMEKNSSNERATETPRSPIDIGRRRSI